MHQNLSNRGLVSLEKFTDSELLSLIKTANPPLTADELEAIATHPRANSKIIAEIVAKANDDSGLLTAIANISRVSRSILQKLVLHSSRGVSETARINLTLKSLRSATATHVLRALEEHSSDSYVDVGIRYNLAATLSMQKSVLRRLAQDDIDSIAACAHQTLLDKANK